jgi:hypothetical protein
MNWNHLCPCWRLIMRLGDKARFIRRNQTPASMKHKQPQTKYYKKNLWDFWKDYRFSCRYRPSKWTPKTVQYTNNWSQKWRFIYIYIDYKGIKYVYDNCRRLLFWSFRSLVLFTSLKNINFKIFLTFYLFFISHQQFFINV